MLGDRYSFERCLPNRDLRRLQASPPRNFQGELVAKLIVGCVRLDAVAYQSGGRIALGYEVLVKESPENPEWICYDSLPDPVGLREYEMLTALDRVVQANHLSYTECAFPTVGSK